MQSPQHFANALAAAESVHHNNARRKVQRQNQTARNGNRHRAEHFRLKSVAHAKIQRHHRAGIAAVLHRQRAAADTHRRPAVGVKPNVRLVSSGVVVGEFGNVILKRRHSPARRQLPGKNAIVARHHDKQFIRSGNAKLRRDSDRKCQIAVRYQSGRIRYLNYRRLVARNCRLRFFQHHIISVAVFFQCKPVRHK